MLMGGYLLARSWSGRLQPAARATIDNTLPMWHCVSVQGLLGMVAVQMAPRLAG